MFGFSKEQILPEGIPSADIYTKLWDLVEATPLVYDCIRPGNQIRFDQNKTDPTKRNISTADTPELILIPEGIQGSLRNSSSTNRIVFQYVWIVSTGDFRYAQILAAIEFGLIAAMTKWCSALDPEGLTTLKWNGASYVKHVDIENQTTGLSDPANNRGIEGWSASLRVFVDCHFSLQSFKDLT